MRPFACRRHESYHFQGVITPFCKLHGALLHCITDMESTLKATEYLSTSHPISADPFQLPHLAKILIRPLSQPVIAVLISIPVMSFGRLHFHISKMSARVFRQKRLSIVYCRAVLMKSFSDSTESSVLRSHFYAGIV